MALATETQLRQYREKGYCLVEELIPVDLIEAARQRTMEIAGDLPDWPERHFQVLDPSRYTAAGGSPLPGGIQQPASQEEVFAQVADHPRLAEVMAGLLGGPVERFTDQIGVKHAAIAEEQGGCSYFHQDSFYWKNSTRIGLQLLDSLDGCRYRSECLGRDAGQPPRLAAHRARIVLRRSTHGPRGRRRLPAFQTPSSASSAGRFCRREANRH